MEKIKSYSASFLRISLVLSEGQGMPFRCESDAKFSSETTNVALLSNVSLSVPKKKYFLDEMNVSDPKLSGFVPIGSTDV